MRFPVYIFLLLIISLLIYSCKKENTTAILGKTIKSYTTNKGPDTLVQFFYDSQNRLVKRSSPSNDYTYEYLTDKIIYTKKVNGVIEFTYYFSLNTNNMATGYERIAGTDTTHWQFIYDSQNFRVKRIQTEDSLNHTDNLILSSNVVEENFYTHDTTQNTNRGIQYYDDKLNSLSYVNYGTTFYGASSKNLKRREVLNTASGSAEFSYTYSFNEEGYVVKTITIITGVDTIVTLYNYN